MKRFFLSIEEVIRWGEDLRERLPRELREKLDKVEFDTECFIRNRTELLPGDPYYPHLAGIRDARAYSFDEACRLRSIHYRHYPGIWMGGAIKEFRDDSLNSDRIFCREDLFAELQTRFSCSLAEANTAFIRLFDGLPDLDPEFRADNPETVCRLPDEWYVHLQISDDQLAGCRWVIRTPTYRVSADGELAAERVRRMRRYRGAFLKRHPLDALRRIWRDSGIYHLSEAKIKREIFILKICRALDIPPEWKFLRPPLATH